MISRLKWSRWDWLIVLVIVIILIRLVAPTSGIAIAIHTVFHWFALGARSLGALLGQIFDLA